MKQNKTWFQLNFMYILTKTAQTKELGWVVVPHDSIPALGKQGQAELYEFQGQSGLQREF